jgi:Ca2+-binding EF-hand superfamily protein
MLGRFDRNGNGMIDPEENNGIAGVMLQRMAQADSSIDLKKPVPLSKISEAFQRMRGGGDGDDSSESDELELLVPDFSLESEPLPPEGFGAINAAFKLKIEDRDIQEAEERIRRYDRNRDNKLSKEELSRGRWQDDPLQYDRNKDGFLVANELAARYASRRIEEEERREERGGRPSGFFGSRGDFGRGGDGGWGGRGGGDDGWNRSEDEASEGPSRFGDYKSFKIVGGGEANEVEGLPSFFARNDKDGDGQVMMNEFSSSWNSETLQEFLKWDLNRDGVITARECLAALEAGTRVGDSSATSPSSSVASSGGSSASSSSPSSSSSSLGGTQIEWAKRQIAKYDKDGDGQLTKAEWDKMIVPPTGADKNGDGVITAEEYAEFRNK